MTPGPASPNESYFRQLCDHAGVGIVACDPDLRIIVWNQLAARTFGAAADRMIGAPILSVIPQDDRPRAEKLLRQAVESGTTSSLEFRHRDENGAPRDLICTVAPVVCDQGRRVGASMWVRDITHRIALQHQVQQSRKMAALGEMAGALAHHFNNILGGVITSVDFAVSTADPQILERVLRQTSRALQRATHLVGGLLAFAEGDLRTREVCDLAEVLRRTCEEVENKLAGSNVTFELKAPILPRLEVGRSQLTTVLRNVIQNAIEAMPEGGPLTIEVRVEDGYVALDVVDAGVGLSETDRSRIFEPFWSTKRGLGAASNEGIGLGLAIAHGIMQMLGGSIAVESTPGRGSRFTIRLPRSPVPPDAPTEP